MENITNKSKPYPYISDEQPTAEEIYYKNCNDLPDTIEEAYKQGLNDMQEYASQQKWIFEEPEEMGWYNVYIEEVNDLGISKYVTTAHYHSDREFDKWTINHKPIGRVVCYQPLPEPPKKGE